MKHTMVSRNVLVKIVINTIIGLILILVWLRFVNIEDILERLSKIEIYKLIPVFLFLALSPIIRAFRLKILLSTEKQIQLKDVVFLNGVATMLNFLIPIRGGEIAKGIYLSHVYGLGMAKSIVWIFIDRFLDFLVVLIFVSILLFSVPTNLPYNFILILAVTTFLGLTVAYILAFNANLAKKLFKFLIPLLIVKSVKIYFERFFNFLLGCFSILKRKPGDLSVLFFVSILAYLADAGAWYFTFLSINFPQPLVNLLLGQMISALTYLVPAAPGYIGSAEASGLLVLSGILRIDPNIASTMTVLFHIVTIIFIITFGVISVYFLKIDLGGILRKIFRKEDAKS